jgi:hypothetical protein
VRDICIRVLFSLIVCSGFCASQRKPIDLNALSSLDFAKLQKIAKAGDAAAQDELAKRYEFGIGVSQNGPQAVEWYRKAANQGFPKAQSDLGGVYLVGIMVPRDPAQAVAWFRKAAEKGSTTAQHALGSCYEHGVGVPQDLAEAHKWYQMAANQGDSFSKAELARLDPPAPPVAAAEASIPQSPQTDDAGAKRQEIEDKIEKLQSDIEEHESAAQTWEDTEQNALSSGCSGPAAGICQSIAQIGAAKARANANKERNAANQDRQEISRLQGEAAAITRQMDTSLAGNLQPVNGQNTTSSILQTADHQAAAMIAIGNCNACSQNPDVAHYTSECSSGTISSCYRAAAALCQCQMNSGGCGYDTPQLQACANSNAQTADSMKGGYTIVPGGTPKSSSKTLPPSGQNLKGCSDQKGNYIPGSASWTACPGW